MSKFPIPSLKTTTANMGKVTVRIVLTNLEDSLLVDRGILSPQEVRSLESDRAIVDTGATRLCLPAALVRQLGLRFQRELNVKTAAGIRKGRLFRGAILRVEGRDGIFDCLELPDGTDPLLGVIPLETLGLEPDLRRQQLRLLPMNEEETYETA